jgi:hypothetical protein
VRGEKRIQMVARRLPNGSSECVITDKPVPGARAVGSMKASTVSLEVGKSKIRMALTKEKKKGEDDDKKRCAENGS